MNSIKFIDLFAGTGGFSEAFKKHTCVYANDMEKSSKEIYKLNHPTHPFELNDLDKIEINTIPKHNILCAGFPCQPFSLAGKKKGFDDERSNVFWKLLKIINYHKPEILILENVKNLESHDKGNTIKIILENLEKEGYYIKYKILDTCKYTDIPHHRERIYIICFKDKNKFERFNFDFKIIKNKQIKDFLETNIDKKYYYTNKLKVYDEIKKSVVKHINENVLYQFRRYYVRENKSNVCPTLTANMGSGGHNVPLLLDDKGIRKLTPRECFNLQGFPKTYKLPMLSDSALYKLAGNAISVPIVSLIVKKIEEF
jgi:DNA (cytosine-5)-methyltransferase 1